MKYLSICSGIEAASVAWEGMGWEPVGFSEIEPFPSAVLKQHWPAVVNLGDVYDLCVDTHVKVLYSVPHGQSQKRIPGSDGDVCAWTVCGRCGGFLWRDPSGDVGVDDPARDETSQKVEKRSGKPLPSSGRALTQESARDCGEGDHQGVDNPAQRVRDVRQKLCACKQSTADRGASQRLQQADGSNLDVQGVPLSMAQAQQSGAKIVDVSDLDVLVAGFPCQDLSVAGKRKGLNDESGAPTRSGLFYRIADLSDAIGQRWLLLENVPGLLSSAEGGDFAVVVGTLAGTEVRVPEGGWQTSGFALGPKGLVEWAVLDAQYFGVPQRRRRVFIVRDSGDWRSRPPILLIPESLSGHPAPGREAGQGIAPSLAARTRGGGGLGTDAECDGALIPQVAPTLGGCSNGGGANGPGRDVDSVESLVCMSSGQANAEIVRDRSPAITCLHEAPIVAHSLRADGFDASEDGTGRGTPLVPVTFHPNQTPISSTDVTHALGCGSSGGQASVAVAFEPGSIARNAGPSGESSLAPTLRKDAGDNQPAVRFGTMVRRLTPTECERLQGFPDGHTAIPWRGKPASECPDGPRYKALGNSFAVPVVRWIGARIKMVEDMKP